MNSQRIGVVLSARTASNRLPAKALLSINGIPMIKFLIDRLKNESLKGKFIFATTTNPTDDYLSKYVSSLAIDVYRGSENDLVKRYLNVAKKYSLDFIVRVTGDCPFVDFCSLNYCLEQVNLDKHFDLWTTKNTFPTGIDYELINTKSLSSSWPKMNIFEKEHLTLYFYENKSLCNFKINDFKPPLNWSKTQETFTVDTFQDYVKVLNIVDELGRIDFRIEDLLKSTNKKF